MDDLIGVSGSGYGSGDGSGSGSGDGSGSGSGDGSEAWWLAVLRHAIAPTRERVIRILESGGHIGFWKSAADGSPSNGGSGGPRGAGDIEQIPGPLAICTKNALHATQIPTKWKGERTWIVALYGEIQRNGDKAAALKREILMELKPR